MTKNLASKLSIGLALLAVLTTVAWGEAVTVHAQVPPERTDEVSQSSDFQPPAQIPVANWRGDIVGYANAVDIYGAPSGIMAIDRDGELVGPTSAGVFDWATSELIGVIGENGFVPLQVRPD